MDRFEEFNLELSGGSGASAKAAESVSATEYRPLRLDELIHRAAESAEDLGGASFYGKLGKRALDIVGSACLLVLLAPLLALLALFTSLDGGPAFFTHTRVGVGGRRFGCYKFRSMVPDAEARLVELLARDPAAAEEWAREHKLTHDPRVTAFGRFLRKSSLDELPQLLNVFRGEMSLVGPRPITEAELHRYGVFARRYLSVKPGLTGPWQVSGRNDLTYDERVRLDARYVETLSFSGDIAILFLTALAVVSMTGK